MAKVMISMPQELVEELDRAAKGQHKRRSELLKELVLQFLRGESASAMVQTRAQRAFQELRQYTFHLKKGETAAGLIRRMRDTR